jgi:glycosyltransferase involved in cell wall biosynthesis
MMGPFCSVIIPTRNRPRELAVCLESFARQGYPRDRFEVIVVDDGSTEPLEPVIERVAKAVDISLLRQANAGPAAARNAGAARARGELLAFTDDDCAPTPEWLAGLARHAAQRPDCAIGGYTLNRLASNWYSTASQLLVSHLYAWYNADAERARFFASNNLALPAGRFHALGGFNAAYPRAAGEDREFCDRWIRHGYRMVFAPEAVVLHAHHLTWRTFWRQHAHYGRGGFIFHQGRARHDRDRFSGDANRMPALTDAMADFEPLSFYVRLILAPYLQRDAPLAAYRKPVLAALMVATQVANAVGFCQEMMARTRGGHDALA